MFVWLRSDIKVQHQHAYCVGKQLQGSIAAAGLGAQLRAYRQAAKGRAYQLGADLRACRQVADWRAYHSGADL
eukprot:360129-Chlamydomonas_euryale.AAC.2